MSTSIVSSYFAFQQLLTNFIRQFGLKSGNSATAAVAVLGSIPACAYLACQWMNFFIRSCGTSARRTVVCFVPLCGNLVSKQVIFQTSQVLPPVSQCVFLFDWCPRAWKVSRVPSRWFVVICCPTRVLVSSRRTRNKWALWTHCPLELVSCTYERYEH